MKLAAGKSSVHAFSSPWAPVPCLLGCQAVRTPKLGTLCGSPDTFWLPSRTGREAASPHEVGQDRPSGVNRHSQSPCLPGLLAPKPRRPDTPNFFLTKGASLAQLPNLQEEGVGPYLGCAPSQMKASPQSLCQWAGLGAEAPSEGRRRRGGGQFFQGV